MEFISPQKPSQVYCNFDHVSCADTTNSTDTIGSLSSATDDDLHHTPDGLRLKKPTIRRSRSDLFDALFHHTEIPQQKLEKHPTQADMRNAIEQDLSWQPEETYRAHKLVHSTSLEAITTDVSLPISFVKSLTQLITRRMVEFGNHPTDTLQLLKYQKQTSKSEFRFPLIEQRQDAQGNVIQLTAYFPNETLRDSVYESIAELDGGISIKMAGTDAIDVATRGIDKSVPVHYFIHNYEAIIASLGFNKNSAPPSVICIDLDGTTYGPELEICPISQNTYNDSSKINQTLIQALKKGHIIFVNTGGTLERSLARLLIGIFKSEDLAPSERSECFSRIIFGSNGGAVLSLLTLTEAGASTPAADIPDCSNETHLQTIKAWVERLITPIAIADYSTRALGQVAVGNTPPATVIEKLKDRFFYIGDGFGPGCNDHPVYRLVDQLFGSEQVFCVTDKSSDKQQEIISKAISSDEQVLMQKLANKITIDDCGNPIQSGPKATRKIMENIIAGLDTQKTSSPQKTVGSEKLQGQVQHYSWGQTGKNAIIPQLTSNQPGDRPWAEFWLGIHPKGPARLPNGDTLLSRYSESQLPWLLKILDAKEMLSVQVHPNQTQAASGYATESTANIAADQRNYKDPNPKPEIAIPLTEMWLMGGFLDKTTMVERFQRYDFIYETFKSTIDTMNATTDSLEITSLKQSLYEQVCRLNPAKVSQLNQQLLHSIHQQDYDKHQIEYWMIKSEEKYPNDIGLFSFFMLNLIQLTPEACAINHYGKNGDQLSLAPGEAYFTPAGIPHFYLEGACIEHMANSDNVLRAGFTPKHKDINELLKVIDYSELSANAQAVKPVRTTPSDGIEKLHYEKRENDYFATTLIKHDSTNLKLEENALSKPQIGLVLEGELSVEWTKQHVQIYRKGESFLIPESPSKQNFSITSRSPDTHYLLARTPEAQKGFDL